MCVCVCVCVCVCNVHLPLNGNIYMIIINTKCNTKWKKKNIQEGHFTLNTG